MKRSRLSCSGGGAGEQSVVCFRFRAGEVMKDGVFFRSMCFRSRRRQRKGSHIHAMGGTRESECVCD